jgi:hypothetical protein
MNILLENTMWNLCDALTIRHPNSKTDVHCKTKRNSTNDVRGLHLLLFVMPATSQIVTTFNAFCSHNFAHNYHHATFTVDCCYYILQHSLRICMSTEASVKFQALHHSTSSTCRNIVRCLTHKQSFLCIYVW